MVTTSSAHPQPRTSRATNAAATLEENHTTRIGSTTR